jgi:quercetin 2,3-dioxygenase
MEATIKKTDAIIIKANSRGKANYGWLNANYYFSFANYFNPERIHFGALRVLNDDVVLPGKGFDTHPHDNMEIITIPSFGTLRHKDSMGHEEDIKPNEVQVMSAGTGIFHSEYNASNSERVGLFQIWIMPQKRNVAPVYDQRFFDPQLAINRWQLLVEPVGGQNNVLTINQQAYVSRVMLSPDESVDYSFKKTSYGLFLVVVEGSVTVYDQTLQTRDAASILNEGDVSIKANNDSYLLAIEVPDVPQK